MVSPHKPATPYILYSGSRSSVADPDPGSGAFLTPGSGIGFFRIQGVPDPGSQDHIFKNFLTISIIL